MFWKHILILIHFFILFGLEFGIIGSFDLIFTFFNFSNNLRCVHEIKSISCPTGFKMSGTQCVNENECLWSPCQNGGFCYDMNPPRKYECKCPFGYTGMNCELELLASGVLTPSRDFVIAIIICASTLICKYFPFVFVWFFQFFLSHSLLLILCLR